MRTARAALRLSAREDHRPNAMANAERFWEGANE